MVGANIFPIRNNTLFCIVDYYSKVPVVKKTDDLSPDSLIGEVKIVFAEFWLPRQIVLDAAINFISQIYTICRELNIEQAITLSYHYQSNGLAQACIKFMKCTIIKNLDDNADIYLALLQMRSTPMGARYLVLLDFYLTDQ